MYPWMEFDILFFMKSAMLGVGLAMDAFSVSLANGLAEPNMKKGKMLQIAGVFAFFQALMPLIGWVCVHNLARLFTALEAWIPWIALGLLIYIGSKMLYEGIQTNRAQKTEGNAVSMTAALGFGTLVVQGIATSIDALSVGFTIAEYQSLAAVLCALIISAVTFIICFGGVMIGKRFGTKLSGKASVLGGIILIAIGLEIWITGVFF